MSTVSSGTLFLDALPWETENKREGNRVKPRDGRVVLVMDEMNKWCRETECDGLTKRQEETVEGKGLNKKKKVNSKVWEKQVEDILMDVMSRVQKQPGKSPWRCWLWPNKHTGRQIALEIKRWKPWNFRSTSPKVKKESFQLMKTNLWMCVFTSMDPY